MRPYQVYVHAKDGSVFYGIFYTISVENEFDGNRSCHHPRTSLYKAEETLRNIANETAPATDSESLHDVETTKIVFLEAEKKEEEEEIKKEAEREEETKAVKTVVEVFEQNMF